MDQWVAVDGGQTGLRLRALPTGRSGSGPGFDHGARDPRQVRDSLLAAVDRAAGQAGVRGRIAVLCAGLSGLPAQPDARSELAYALGALLDVEEVRLTTDVVTAHAGALSGRAGVVLSAGTGVVALGLDAAGRAHRVDGWGHRFGDAGSAFDIGRRALEAVQRAYDGRGGVTRLAAAARREFDVTPEELPQRLSRSRTFVADVAAFAPAVVRCAEEGDPVAAEILRGAAVELARTASAAWPDPDAERQPDPVPLARVGRLWDAGDALTDPFVAELARVAPWLESAPPDGDALRGAERLATSERGVYGSLVDSYRPRERGAAVGAARAVGARRPEPGQGSAPFERGSLLVSCQAQPESPLYGPEPMAAMARAAIEGGAAGIRANGEEDVAAIRAVTELPLIGLRKQGSRDGVYITPTIEAAEAVAHAGADIVAMDGTPRTRTDGATLAEQIAAVHARGALVLADVDAYAAGAAAREAGADLIATSLAGYTGDGVPPDEPDLALLAALASELDCPVIAEGRYRTGADFRAALDAGAYAVVIGTAITNPTAITRRILGTMAG